MKTVKELLKHLCSYPPNPEEIHSPTDIDTCVLTGNELTDCDDCVWNQYHKPYENMLIHLEVLNEDSEGTA